MRPHSSVARPPGARKRRSGPIAEADADHIFDRGLADDLSKGRGCAAEYDNGLDAGVIQLMLKLARRVKRIDAHLSRARTHDPKHGDGKSRDVGKHDGNAVALLHAQPGL